MRPEDVQVTLRPRSAWEAVELGTALVRRHAGAVWRPWLALSVPVFVLVNTLFWWLDQLWLAGLALWWWLPVFDRIPLYVLSRAVFGQVPGVMQTLRALPDWRRGRLVAHLTWRRLSPWRTLGLPVDLLEEGTPAAKRVRRRQIVHGQHGHGLLLTGLCAQFVLVLVLAVVLGGLLFVPAELMQPSARALWTTLADAPPRWAQVGLNAVLWLGLSVIEPFHVGAGFGLYLNRRVHLEGWDIELALRRLHARLRRGAGAVLLVACVLLLPGGAAARAGSGVPAAQAEDANERRTLADIFGDERVADVHAFIEAVEVAGQDPLLNQQEIRQTWIARTVEDPAAQRPPWWRDRLIPGVARFSEAALWVLAAGLALLLALTAPRWWPWMRRAARMHERTPDVTSTPVIAEPPLPSDVLASARALWRAEARRKALALLYRGSLATLAEHPDIVLSASATEAECLRLSCRLREPAQHAAFARMVQVWQYAAYAGRWPDDTEFDALGGELAQRLGWPG